MMDDIPAKTLIKAFIADMDPFKKKLNKSIYCYCITNAYLQIHLILQKQL